MIKRTLQDKKIIVTGGLGFIGRSLCQRLAQERPADILVIDDLSCPSADETAWDNVNHTSVCDYDKLEALFQAYQPNFIFHLAAEQIAAAQNNIRTNFETNCRGVFNILHAALSIKDSLEGLVYTSSCSVYGNKLGAKETDSLDPLTFYSVSKLTGEYYCLNFYLYNKLPVIILRINNTYGPGRTMADDYTDVITKFINAAHQGDPLRLINGGNWIRSFCYISDTVEGILTATQAGRLGQVYNIGSDKAILGTKIVELVKVHYPQAAVELIPPREIDEIQYRSVSGEKAYREFGWKPTISIEEGIARIVFSLNMAVAK
jgi:UDP-glucose 4-epimerase